MALGYASWRRLLNWRMAAARAGSTGSAGGKRYVWMSAMRPSTVMTVKRRWARRSLGQRARGSLTSGARSGGVRGSPRPPGGVRGGRRPSSPLSVVISRDLRRTWMGALGGGGHTAHQLWVRQLWLGGTWQLWLGAHGSSGWGYTAALVGTTQQPPEERVGVRAQARGRETSKSAPHLVGLGAAPSLEGWAAAGVCAGASGGG